MTDQEKAMQATPYNQLINEIMNANIPKSEREWAAKEEIESQRRTIDMLTRRFEDKQIEEANDKAGLKSIIEEKDREIYRLRVQSDGLMEACNQQHFDNEQLQARVNRMMPLIAHAFDCPERNLKGACECGYMELINQTEGSK